jgi:alpha-L-fucosidase
MRLDRRSFIQTAGKGAVLSAAMAGWKGRPAFAGSDDKKNKGKGGQRLSVERLRVWEDLGYGMFIHFGMSTFTGQELPDGRTPAAAYAPDRLDVDQWVSVARDAGMKYAVLTAKHVAGHCLWPSAHTDYTVQNSTDKTDVVEAFIRSCEKREIRAGLYYCSWDNHHRFGSKTPSDGGWEGMNGFPVDAAAPLPPYTTSLYHHFQTAQITELLTRYGPICETWIDIPGVLGRGYRTFLYGRIAGLQPDTIIMMNSGIGDGTNYDAAYAWPSDLIAIERDRPPKAGHEKWRTIEDRCVYLPAEHCDPVGREWFFVEGDPPRSDESLLEQFRQTRASGVNFLLDVPPDRHGRIPLTSVDALMRLRKNAGI